METSNSNIESTLKLDQVIKEKEELWIKNQELNENYKVLNPIQVLNMIN